MALVLLVKIANKNINPGRLVEEIAGLPIPTISWAGFTTLGDRLAAPFDARRQVGTLSDGTPDFADPGELRLFASRVLTVLEEADLDAILLAHVAAVQSAEQVRQDQDDADLVQLRSDYDALSPLQKAGTQGRMLRLLLRRERGASL